MTEVGSPVDEEVDEEEGSGAYRMVLYRVSEVLCSRPRRLRAQSSAEMRGEERSCMP